MKAASRLWWVFVVCLSLGCKKEPPAPATPPPSPTVTTQTTTSPAPTANAAPQAEQFAKAQWLLDSFEGRREPLDQSRKIVMDILAQDKNYAPAYVALAQYELLSLNLLNEEQIKLFDYPPDNFEEKEKERLAKESQGMKNAHKFVNHALKLDPTLADAHFTLGRIWLVGGDYDLAREAAERGEELKPNDVRGKVLRMNTAWEEENASQAEKLSKEIIESTTATPEQKIEAYDLLGDLYEKRGDFGPAESTYVSSLRMRPDSAWLHGNYAAFLVGRRRYDEAISHGERALSIMQYPYGQVVVARAHMKKAEELWEGQRHGEAVQQLERAVRVGGGNANIYYDLGMFYRVAWAKSRQPDLLRRAGAAFQEALKIDPKHERAKGELTNIQTIIAREKG